MHVEDEDSGPEEEPPAPEEERPQYWSGYTPKQRKELGVVDHSMIQYHGVFMSTLGIVPSVRLTLIFYSLAFRVP